MTELMKLEELFINCQSKAEIPKGAKLAPSEPNNILGIVRVKKSYSPPSKQAPSEVTLRGKIN